MNLNNTRITVKTYLKTCKKDNILETKCYGTLFAA